MAWSSQHSQHGGAHTGTWWIPEAVLLGNGSRLVKGLTSDVLAGAAGIGKEGGSTGGARSIGGA